MNEKNIPSGQNPTIAWGKTPMGVGILPHSFASWYMVLRTCDYFGTEYFKNI